MSKNLKKKALAFGSMFGLVVSGVVSMPAAALDGEVELEADYGSGYGVFIYDTFELEADIRDGNGLYSVDEDDDQLIPNVTLEITGIGGKDIDLEGYLDNDDMAGLERALIRESLITTTYSATDGTDEDTDLDSFTSTTSLAEGGVAGIYADAYDADGNLLDTLMLVSEEGYEDEFAEQGDFRDIDGFYLNSSLFDVAEDEEIDRIVIENIPAFTRNLDYDLWQNSNDFGDGNVSVSTRVWVENSGSSKTVETAYASPVRTVTWYDPKPVRATARMEKISAWGEDGLMLLDDTTDVGFTVKFSVPVNYEQISDKGSLDDWYYELYSGSSVAVYEEDADVTDSLDDDTRYPWTPYVEGDDASLSDSDRLIINTGYVAEEGEKLYVKVWYEDESDEGTKFPSNSVTIGSSAAATDVDGIEVGVNQPANHDQAEAGTTDIALRAGTKSFTYTLQLMDNPDEYEVASVDVMAFIYPAEVGYLEEDSIITATGAPGQVDEYNAAIFATGVTNRDGQWNVTVNHSGAIAGEAYYLDFYVLDDGGWRYLNDLYVEYENARVESFEPASDVYSGSKVDVEFEVLDQFGEPISTRGTSPLGIELTSASNSALVKTAAVTAGKATISFDNYLTGSNSDTLIANLYYGGNTDNVLSTVVMNLFASVEVGSISVAEEVEGAVAYSDFITGIATSTNRAPTDASTEISGAIVDKNGNPVGGAVVTFSATGVQFFDGSKYSIGSASDVTDSLGNFSVEAWTHKASALGEKITIKAGAVTETVDFVSYLPNNLGGANLNLSWTLPAQVVKNTTYAVPVKLTDKWGNPVNTSTEERALTVTAAGSIEVNGDDTVLRNFGADGVATVFIRSVLNIAGPGSLTATLDTDAEYLTIAGGESTFGDLGRQTNLTTTVWDESKWSDTLEADIQVLDAPTGKVNVGSFNGKLVVYASGLAGAKISWKVGGNWGSAVATSNFARFDRPTPRRGVTVTVDIYVNGVKQLTKSVVTR